MDPIDNDHVREFDKALEGWTDQRFISREQIRILAMFNMYLVNLADLDGWTYTGRSLSQGSPMCRLVVRGELDGIPSVVFTSGRTPMACIKIFMRKLHEGWLEWVPDKYRS